MPEITNAEIRKHGGLLSALSVACSRTVREILGSHKTYLPQKLKQINLFLTHKDPHLDEYMAMLLFKATLPEQYWVLPFDEVILNSARYDLTARATWPNAAVIGLGGGHDGGATAACRIDEHTRTGEKRKATSATMLTRKYSLAPDLLPQSLFRIIGEVDHIDSHANSHKHHLGQYIKKAHSAQFRLGTSAKGNIIETLTPQWKQAIVEAVIVAALVALQKGVHITDKSYWYKPARDSLQDYMRLTLLKDEPEFLSAWKSLYYEISGCPISFLEIRNPDGTKTQKMTKDSKPIPQNLVMPYLAAACQDVWGPQLGQMILVHFWEIEILSQMEFTHIDKIFQTVIGDKKSSIKADTPIGHIDFHLGKHVRKDSKGIDRLPWIIGFTAAARMQEGKAPLLRYLNQANGGVGYILNKNAQTGTIALTKGSGISQNEWERLIRVLLEREGNSDDEEPGCWHVPLNANDVIAPYILNGNSAHRYVPATALTPEVLTDMINGEL